MQFYYRQSHLTHHFVAIALAPIGYGRSYRAAIDSYYVPNMDEFARCAIDVVSACWNRRCGPGHQWQLLLVSCNRF